MSAQPPARPKTYSGPRRPFHDTPGVCDWCGKPLPSGSRCWCSDECARAWLATWYWPDVCKAVYERDGGTCALCGYPVGRVMERIHGIRERRHREAQRWEQLLNRPPYFTQWTAPDGKFHQRLRSGVVWRCVGRYQDMRQPTLVKELLRCPEGEIIRSWLWHSAEKEPDAMVHGGCHFRRIGDWVFQTWIETEAPWFLGPEAGGVITMVAERIRKRHGYPSHKRWYEFDHIKPRVEGGEDTPDNLRVLCVPCHVAETAKLAGRRAEARQRARRETALATQPELLTEEAV